VLCSNKEAMMLKGTHIYPLARRTIFFVEFNARVFIRMFVAFMHGAQVICSVGAAQENNLLCYARSRDGMMVACVLGPSFVGTENLNQGWGLCLLKVCLVCFRPEFNC
jgi:hypothetical protein